MAADPYQIRLDDDPAIKPQTRESTYDWAGDHAEISLWTKVKRQVESGGAFDIPSDGSTHAIVNHVTRAGIHRSAVIWRKVGDALFVPGEIGTLVVSARLRMSVSAFTPPFAKSRQGRHRARRGPAGAAAVDQSTIFRWSTRSDGTG
jgi:hypothetical protein